MTDLPIGIFDSGIGGLTVLAALERHLPNESFVYLGDTARLPYGTKSAATVTRYAVRAAHALTERGIKLLVVACNTASAIALDALEKEFRGLPVLGVVRPGAAAASRATHTRRIAVLSTEGTAREGAYVREIHRHLPDAEIVSIPCPIFVALAEEGWTSPPHRRGRGARILERGLSKRHFSRAGHSRSGMHALSSASRNDPAGRRQFGRDRRFGGNHGGIRSSGAASQGLVRDASAPPHGARSRHRCAGSIRARRPPLSSRRARAHVGGVGRSRAARRMNHLAHCLLADIAGRSIAGSMAGDFLRGPLPNLENTPSSAGGSNFPTARPPPSQRTSSKASVSIVWSTPSPTTILLWREARCGCASLSSLRGRGGGHPLRPLSRPQLVAVRRRAAGILCRPRGPRNRGALGRISRAGPSFPSISLAKQSVGSLSRAGWNRPVLSKECRAA